MSLQLELEGGASRSPPLVDYFPLRFEGDDGLLTTFRSLTVVDGWRSA